MMFHVVPVLFMMTSSNGNIFRVTGHLCGEFTVPVISPHKGQSSGALMFSLISVWINGWVNNREAGDLRRYRAHYDVTVMLTLLSKHWLSQDDNLRVPKLLCPNDRGCSTRFNFRSFWSKPNMWNVNCARATAFIFDTRTGVLEKVSKILRQKMSRPEGDSKPQPSDSCRIL